jgi:3-polyprenyl-4-hydroxybenzoate decarboxylase
MTPRRLIVAMSGSSAPQLGKAVLQALHRIEDVETHLILSEGARQTIKLDGRRRLSGR